MGKIMIKRLRYSESADADLQAANVEKVFAIFCEWMKPITDSSYCQISFELSELDPVLKFNKNNIHALFK